MAHYRYYMVNDWTKMLDVRIQNKSPPIIQFGFIRFSKEPQLLFFVNIPSIILRPDKYNKMFKNRSLMVIKDHNIDNLFIATTY